MKYKAFYKNIHYIYFRQAAAPPLDLWNVWITFECNFFYTRTCVNFKRDMIYMGPPFANFTLKTVANSLLNKHNYNVWPNWWICNWVNIINKIIVANIGFKLNLAKYTFGEMMMMLYILAGKLINIWIQFILHNSLISTIQVH